MPGSVYLPRKFRIAATLAVAVALTSTAPGALAAPQLFQVSATVQNAVTITETTRLNFGTVFVAQSAAVAAGATDATVAAPLSNKVTLSPAGAASPGVTVPGAPMLSLSGGTAGSYSVPGLPVSATVRLIITNASAQGTFANADSVLHANCGYNTPADALTAGKLVLSLTGSNPTSNGFFCLDALTAAVGATDVTTRLLPTATFAAIPVATDATGYTLGFGATSLAFNLGATLVQQVPTSGVRHQYESGDYTGQIGLELTFL